VIDQGGRKWFNPGRYRQREGVKGNMKVLEPPNTLNDEGKKMWFETLSYLKELGTLEMVTPKELAAFCRAYFRQFQRGKPGDDQIRVMKKGLAAGDVVLKFCSKYGLTPMSRVRLGLAYWDGEKFVNLKKKPDI
jgi:phage terminase small subunit